MTDRASLSLLGDSLGRQEGSSLWQETCKKHTSTIEVCGMGVVFERRCFDRIGTPLLPAPGAHGEFSEALSGEILIACVWTDWGYNFK